MAQTQRSKPPLDVLQSMINGILIETGRALKSSDKEGGRSFASANTRLRTTIPSAVENFHQALDELECDIIRAKAALLRDLEELRSKRYALENPVKVEEEHIEMDNTATTSPSDDVVAIVASTQAASIKEGQQSTSPEKQDLKEPNGPIQLTQDEEQALSATAIDGSKSQQGPTPPSSNLDAGSSTKPIGLGINTEGIPETISAPGTAGVPDSSVDSLFDIPDNDNNNGGPEINFDGMDFSLHDTSINTQNQDQSQTQVNDFDLSAFGNTSQDFNITDLHTSDATMANNTNNDNTNKQLTDLFDMDNNTGAADNMDLDNMDIGMAEESVFDDIFFAGGDDRNLGGVGEMEHGEFDSAFFGLDE